jgi:hypothetical protein
MENSKKSKKRKVISETGRRGLWGCEMLNDELARSWPLGFSGGVSVALRLKSLETPGLDNRLTDGGKVVSPAHRPHYTPQKHYFSSSDAHFC